MFLRFVSALFVIFEKGINKKLGQFFLRFVSMLFSIFGKGGKLRIGLGFFLRFVILLFFNILKS